MIELIIQNGNTVFYPCVVDGIEWTTERVGSAGKLSFSVVQDATLKITEGNAVRLRVDDDDVFFGFIFSIKRSQEQTISITAYDQLRYLKNKHTYQYTKTATQLIQMIAKDFELKTDMLEDTKFVIANRIEDGKTLFDMIKNALDITLQNTKNLYIVYDNFGKIALKSLENMKVPILIDADTAQEFAYESSIDSNTYNQIVLYYDNKNTGKRETYIAKDTSKINEWGVLQYYEKLNDEENGKEKVDALLKLYNEKTRSLSINSAIGDNRVRGGSMVAVQLDLGEIQISNWMIVESVTHKYEDGEHWMNLKLRGGVING